MISNQRKDGSRVDNYRSLTTGTHICRTYWGIVDKMLREVISFSPREKGFVYETGCFNSAHILNETNKPAKTKNRLVAIHLDIAKAFDTFSRGHLGGLGKPGSLEWPVGVDHELIRA